MTTTWEKWRIYCETESIWTEGIIDSNNSPPTVCFTDSGHTVNTNSQQKLQTLSTNNVKILEEDTPTGEHYKSVCYKITAAVGNTTHDYTFPYPISALSISFNSTSDNMDDNLEVAVAPDTTVGTITADVSSSDTVINVSQTVIDNAELGFYIKIDDLTNTDDLGVVTAIDTVNNTITVETAATQSFLAATPTYIKMSVKVIDNFTFGPQGRYILGDSKIGGSYVSANTTIRIYYTNNGGNSVNFYPVIEYLY